MAEELSPFARKAVSHAVARFFLAAGLCLGTYLDRTTVLVGVGATLLYGMVALVWATWKDEQ